MTEEEKRIEKEKEMKRIQQLEEWSGLKFGETIFDSDVDQWSIDKSEFDDKIKGKKQLVFLIEDKHGEKFGYYLNTEVNNQYNEWIQTDDKSFEFNIQSNGRLDQMMKFPIKDTQSGYKLYDKENALLIQLGDIWLCKQNNNKLSSCCEQNEDKFDYQGIESVLCGKLVKRNENNKLSGDEFYIVRLKVFQMK